MSSNNSLKLLGKRFGRLVVICFHGYSKGHGYWVCKCDCGKTKVILGSSLNRGLSRSCACLVVDVNSTHKMSQSNNGRPPRLYRIWSAMKYRCSNPKNSGYRWYGAKGITVCKEWLSYINFYSWAITHSYSDNLTIDRKNSKMNYCPENCQWITQSENSKKTDVPYGESHINSKLTEEKVLSILLEHRINKTGCGALSMKYEISPSVVSSIINGKAWRRCHGN